LLANSDLFNSRQWGQGLNWW